ncbi:MAG: hypothetical protein MR384_10820 [Lachnospiraceae bacterium]|nr:hypothetical protein [Lachnospiraceae bacterium]
MYRKDKWAETPDGVNQNRFRHNIRQGVRMEEHYGVEVLKHKKFNKFGLQKKNMNWLPGLLPETQRQKWH